MSLWKEQYPNGIVHLKYTETQFRSKEICLLSLTFAWDNDKGNIHRQQFKFYNGRWEISLN